MEIPVSHRKFIRVDNPHAWLKIAKKPKKARMGIFSKSYRNFLINPPASLPYPQGV